MALTPKQAKEAYEKMELDTAKKYESEIDHSLAQGSRTFAVSKFGYATAKAIAKYYQSLGWKVAYINDQRDGDFLKFKE